MLRKVIQLKELYKLILRVLELEFMRKTGSPKVLPTNLTVSVTNACNSKCNTCFIWRFHSENTSTRKAEFTVAEFAEVFKSLGDAPYWITLSGGEPFLRTDLPKICEASVNYCHPAIINIPTNGLEYRLIEKSTKAILKKIGHTHLVINLSLDGVGKAHDEIRGVPGNFQSLVESYKRLVALKEEWENLTVGIHTVVSRFNVHDLLDIYDFSKTLRPDNYITEVAEERSELFNVGTEISPDPKSYSAAIEELISHMRSDSIDSGRRISKVRSAFRFAYYDIVMRYMREQRQIIPCYAGYASCQITSYGDVWPCCVLGYGKAIGNLREHDYDFEEVWFSKRAEETRKHIKAGQCACPLANAHYTSILCDFRSMMKVIKGLVSESVSQFLDTVS